MPRIERSGDDLYFLYTGGTTGMPKGVMWRNDDLWGVLADGDVPARRRGAPERPAEVGRDRRSDRRRGRDTACTCPRRRSCTAPARSRRSRRCWVGGAHRHARRPALRPARAVADRAARAASRRWRSSATRSPSRCCSALEEAEADGHAVRHLVARADHQLGRDVVGRGQAGPDGSAATSSASTRSVRAKASASRTRSPRPAPKPKTAKFTIGADTKVFKEDGDGGRARLRRGRAARGRRQHPGRLLQGRREDRRRRSMTINGSRWSVPGDFASVEADGTIVLLGRGSVVHQLGRREDLPRRGRGSGEAPPRGRRLPRRRRARRPLRRSGHRGRRRCARRAKRPATRSAARSRRSSRFKRPRSYVFVPEVAARARTARPTTSGPRPSPPTASADDWRSRHSDAKRDGHRPSLAMRRAAPTSPELLLLPCRRSRPWRARRGR